MASLEQQLKLMTEEIAQLNAKLDDVSEKIDDEMCKAESAQNPALLGRLTKKEERLLAEKDNLLKLRSKLLTGGGQVAASSAELPPGAAPLVAAPFAAATNPAVGACIGETTTRALPLRTVEAPTKAEPQTVKDKKKARPEETKDDNLPTTLGRRLVKDPCHPHPFEFSSFNEDRNRGCDICYLGYNKETAYCGYLCKGCNYSAHIGCLSSPVDVKAWTKELEEQYLTDAFGPPAVKDLCHPHALSRTTLSQGACCDICYLGFDKKDGYYGYLCAKCDYCTHVKCLTSPKDASTRNERSNQGYFEETLGPRLVKDPCHPHPFEYYSFSEDRDRACDICYLGYEKKTAYLGYLCKGCNYSAHIGCLSSAMEVKAWTKELEEQSLTDAFGPSAVKDPCHPHALNRTTLSVGAYCDICYLGFDRKDGYYGYLCAKCNYCTHAKCLTSPKDALGGVEHSNQGYLEETIGPLKVKDPSHPHFLDLKSFHEKGAYCNVCYKGFASKDGFYGYFCKRCKYAAHAKCLKSAKAVKKGRAEEEDSSEEVPEGWTLIDSKMVLDVAHKHSLKHYNVKDLGYTCYVCAKPLKKDKATYACVKCDFAVHPKCHKEKGSHGAAEEENGGEEKEEDEEEEEEEEEEEPQEEADHLPVDSRTVQDPCHPHTLKCYRYAGSHCDICTSTIDGASDKFGCRDCDFDAHFSCLTADLGLPAKLTDARHPHGLTLHPKAKRGDLQGRYACAGCEGIGRTWVYECDEAECDFKVHPDCARVEVKGHSAFGHWLALAFSEQSACALPECALKGTRSYVLRCCVGDWKEGATCDAFLHVDCANKIVAPHAPQRAAETVAAIKAAKEAADAHMKQLQIVQLQRQNQQMAMMTSMHNHNMNSMNISRLNNALGRWL